ncbi:hypothetical protein ACA30_21390 [Virgibacillus soli]|uniref:hypothetical protein n=1 Tax=Virgibacillus sp. MG-45 TaxID=3102791 RepID=UPI00071600A1|nr:hypothetical protein ACA30_21390 [Virgibacillus soli]
MNKMILKKLYLREDLQIFFNTGQNYIIGKNNTGKTTIFNIMQYVLGLKRVDINSEEIYSTAIEPYIECQFGREVYKISRKFGSNEITFQGDINVIVNADSYELNDLYAKLLNISFENELNFNNDNINNDHSSIDIIKMSFLSEIELSKTYLNRGNNYYKILGYNEDYLKLIKNDISSLKNELKFETKSLKTIEQYKESVENTLKTRYVTKQEEITKILEDEYSIFRNKYLNKTKLLHNAEEVYEKELRNFKDSINNEISKLNPYFLKIIKEISPITNSLVGSDLQHVIELKNMRNMSIGQRVLLLWALHITLCRNEVQNGLGMLITDSILPKVDIATMKSIRNKISNITKNGELQYIEFCTENSYVPKESVVFEMPSKRGGGIFE